MLTFETLEDLGSVSGRLKVLNWFMGHTKKTSGTGTCVILAHVDDISKDVGHPVVSVRRWVSFLLEKGYIKKHQLFNGHVISNAYVVNPEYVTKGKLVRDKDEEVRYGGKNG